MTDGASCPPRVVLTGGEGLQRVCSSECWLVPLMALCQLSPVVITGLQRLTSVFRLLYDTPDVSNSRQWQGNQCHCLVQWSHIAIFLLFATLVQLFFMRQISTNIDKSIINITYIHVYIYIYIYIYIHVHTQEAEITFVFLNKGHARTRLARVRAKVIQDHGQGQSESGSRSAGIRVEAKPI